MCVADIHDLGLPRSVFIQITHCSITHGNLVVRQRNSINFLDRKWTMLAFGLLFDNLQLVKQDIIVSLVPTTQCVLLDFDLKYHCYLIILIEYFFVIC